MPGQIEILIVTLKREKPHWGARKIRELLVRRGAAGAFYDNIRRCGYYVSLGERDRTMASIAVPVLGTRRRLFGAVCVSGTVERLGRVALLRHLPRLLKAAAELSRAVSSSVTRYEIAQRRWRS